MSETTKETTEKRAARLMKKDRLTADNVTDMKVSADIIASRSQAAYSIAQRMRQAAEAMQQEAQRLHTLADQIAAAAADTRTVADDNHAVSAWARKVKVFE